MKIEDLRKSSWDNNIEHGYPPKFTLEDAIGIIAASIIATALLVGIVIVGH